MSQMGISGLMNTMSANYLLNNMQGTAKTASLSATDIDKTENDSLELTMLISDTKSDASASYFTSLQEAIKDSKGDGFEAYRRVNKLTATHEKVASSREYEKKAESKSLVKDLADAMDEKRKEIDEIIEKREEKEELVGKQNKSAESTEDNSSKIINDSVTNDTSKSKVTNKHKITIDDKTDNSCASDAVSTIHLPNRPALGSQKSERVSDSQALSDIYRSKSRKNHLVTIDQMV